MKKQLLLFSIKGEDFAAWKEEIEDVRKIDALSHLPLDSNGIFDITLIDGQVTYLYDLFVCLGLPSIDKEKKKNAFIMSGGNEATGFTVEGEIKQILFETEKALPLQDYLKTDIIDTIIEYGSKPVPVINLSALHACFQQPEHKTSVPGLHLSGIKRKKKPAAERFWTFSCCYHFFAASYEHIDTVQVQGDNISKLPLTPSYVEGIIIHNGRVLPLIRLSDCLGLAERTVPESAFVLEVEEEGQCFGFLVDSVGENFDGESVQVFPLPPLASTAWMCKAILSKQGIMPRINLFILLDAQQDKVPEQIPSQQYTLDSRFSSLQYTQEIEVVEFTIFGIKYALPGCEMEETVPFKPFWRVPTQNPVVAGVAEHEGTILPVIDLAPYFGKNLTPAPGRNMMLITNGDFRVLLAVETVLGRRRLALNLQKELPVHLSEDVVYGCYLDENAVTLILNIASMAFRAEGLNTKELPGVLSAMEPPGAEAQDIAFESSWKTEYSDRQETEAESKTASVIIEKAEIEKDEFSEIPVIDEKATVNGAASVLLPESEIEADALKGDSQGKEEIEGETAIPVSEAETAPESEEKPGALKGDSQGKEEIEGETEIPVSEAETVPESEREAAAQEETSDTEAGLHKMEEAAAAGRLETKETEQSSQLQASPSLEDTGKKDVDKTFRGKKRIWYIIASILAICLLFAIYFVFAPADWKPGDTGTSIKKETITTEKEIPAFPSDSASEEDGKTGETDQAGREETVISYLTHFPPDSSLFLPGEIDNLMRIAASIKQDSPIKIIITGHTDRVGTEESCLILSEERAEAVRNKLISLSAFDESKVITRGAGASEPIADQSTPEGRSRNRRVEIRLVY